ncbi:MAG: RNA pyrophosphohydrolase [Proteobacteria bacterium]|nr:RNA pyrophosphohydrolase [Pseudomonadota bacterium]
MLDYYRPGVGIMLFNQQGLVFTGMRIDMPGAWQMPQGGVDVDEKPIEAAIRELEEEIGTSKVKMIVESADWHYYDVPKEIAERLWHGKWYGQKQKWFLAEFAGTDEDINIHTSHPEFQSWRWSTLEELVANIVEFKRPLYVAVIKEFAPILEERGF